MTQTVEIIVAPNGATRLETRGFTGRSCLDASRFLEQALGQRTQDQRTTEFYAQEATDNQLQQHDRG